MDVHFSNTVPFWVLLACVPFVGALSACSGPETDSVPERDDSALKKEQRAKIDDDLLRLMTDTLKISTIPSRQRPDSTWEYAVRIQSADVEPLRTMGVVSDTASGTGVRTWLSMDEIRRVARITAVEAIRADNDPLPRKEPE